MLLKWSVTAMFKLEAKDVYQTKTARRPPKGRKCPVFVPGDFDY